MPSLWAVLGGVYELSTVVTDVVLNNEYIKRQWTEEYALSIAFLVFNGLVMAVIGLHLERAEPEPRYVRSRWLSKLIAAVIGLLQLRVLVEKANQYIVSVRPEEEQPATQPQQYPNTSTQHDAESKEQALRRLEEGLVYVAFVQAMVRDVPIFVIQANATIHYHKWELVDLWAVVSTGVTLVNAVSSYVTKRQPEVTHVEQHNPAKGLAVGATIFLVGQFVFRLGAILLVAKTTGSTVVIYACVLVVIAVVSAVALRHASPAQATSAQISVAVLLFPLFTIFTLDASHLSPRGSDIKAALYSKQVLLLNAWRVIENGVGVLLAVIRPRYTKFGVSTDKEIALIGGACALFFLVAFVVFAVLARKASAPLMEDKELYLRNSDSANQPNHPPQYAPSQGYPGAQSLTSRA